MFRHPSFADALSSFGVARGWCWMVWGGVLVIVGFGLLVGGGCVGGSGGVLSCVLGGCVVGVGLLCLLCVDFFGARWYDCVGCCIFW